MEKNISLSAETQHSNFLWKNLARCILQPIEWLRRYYTQVMEREVSLKQTGLLLNAQLAFVMTAFPLNVPLIMRFVCCAWLLHAVLTCKQSFAD